MGMMCPERRCLRPEGTSGDHAFFFITPRWSERSSSSEPLPKECLRIQSARTPAQHACSDVLARFPQVMTHWLVADQSVLLFALCKGRNCSQS